MTPGEMALSEQDIIKNYLAPLARETKGALGLSDDAACFRPRGGHDLVLTCDTLVAGVHFFADDFDGALAGKALAVNISDLVAKGATPRVFLLSLAFPDAPERGALSHFVGGLRTAAHRYGCGLIGGDTTRTDGPLTISITAIGEVPEGKMVKRAGAAAGDRLFVSGTIGDGALGLLVRESEQATKAWQLSAQQSRALLGHYLSPNIPAQLTAAIRRYATAAMDISDGLVGDLERLCETSGVGAELHVQNIPLSKPVQRALAADATLIERVLTGGDDYQILAGVPEVAGDAFKNMADSAGVAVTEIGVITARAAGVKVIGRDGALMQFTTPSFQHF